MSRCSTWTWFCGCPIPPVVPNAAHSALRRLVDHGVERRRVGRIDPALERLQPVAFLPGARHHALLGPEARPFEAGRRRRLAAPEIGPHDAAVLDRRIGDGAHLALELAARRLGRHVDAAAGHVELPAMVDAAQTAFLVSPEEERHPAVRAVFLEHAHPAVRVAERDEPLAEQPDAHRRAVARDLLRKQRRRPILSHHPAERRTRSDPGHQFVVFARKHAASPTVASTLNDGVRDR
jgi:hypothetical protein